MIKENKTIATGGAQRLSLHAIGTTAVTVLVGNDKNDMVSVEIDGTNPWDPATTSRVISIALYAYKFIRFECADWTNQGIHLHIESGKGSQ